MIIEVRWRFSLVIIWLLLTMLITLAIYSNASGLEFKPISTCSAGSIYWRHNITPPFAFFDCDDFVSYLGANHLKTSLRFDGSNVGRTKSITTIIDSKAGIAISSAHIIKRNDSKVVSTKDSSIECSLLPGLIMLFAVLLMFGLVILTTKFFLH